MIHEQNINDHFYAILDQVPGPYRDELVSSYEAIKDHYPIRSHQMPRPAWRRKGYDDSGQKAWEKIKERLSKGETAAPISIYVHIPFCRTKCGFCDCLSVPIMDDSLTGQFTQAILKEIGIWAGFFGLKKQPVTVLYFGGGTPNSISDDSFKQIIREITGAFSIHPETQISVECTAHLLTPERIDFLKSLRVSRISIGIQTLEEPLRFRIGRHSTAAEVLDAIRRCKRAGLTTCGDIVYGLPEQTMTGFIETVGRLIDAGLDGLSMYRFNVLDQNRRFVEENFHDFTTDDISNYAAFDVGHHLLYEAGYRKNHVIHFSKNDSNLYYRHLLRGEDLIAVGPTSDGVVDSYIYRHPYIQRYVADMTPEFPSLVGGVVESPSMQRIKGATVQLMCGEIKESVIEQLQLQELIRKWEKCKILEKSNKDSYSLSANGSWFIDQLFDELENTVDH